MIDIQLDPHRRFNPLTGEWVLVSPHRNRRPWLGRNEPLPPLNRPAYDPGCYLCPGNTRASGAVNPDYPHTFTFTNDFAALLPPAENEGMQDGLLRAEPESGICRVICFSPHHSLTLARMSDPEVLKVVEAWQDEFRELGARPDVRHVQIFENKGELMGCSNPHPHGQVWAQSSLPPLVRNMGQRQADHYEREGRSLLCDLLDQELKAGERLVAENEDFVVLVPFWAVWPFETMIVPRRHMRDILEMERSEARSFAAIIARLAAGYDRLFDTDFPYSAGIRQRPTDGGEHRGWHWHMSFLPPLLRSATVKKFMVGYELFAMPQRDISPEQAAGRLRSCV